MRMWIQFSKGPGLRYLSHLDLMRAWQRAIRRAGLPVAHSAGFNPHPKMSFAAALPVGVTSEAEYLDIRFKEPIDQGSLERLKATLPPGLTVLNSRTVPLESPSLMAVSGAAEWIVPLPEQEVAELALRVGNILKEQELAVQRAGKKGSKTVNIRPLIYRLEADTQQQRLVMLLATGGDGGAKPREVLSIINLQQAESRLHKTRTLITTAGSCLQSPMFVLLNEKEVFVDAKKDCYQL